MLGELLAMNVFNTYDLLAAGGEDRADRTAIVAGHERASYGDVMQRVDSLAAWLLGQGVQRGDRVGIHLTKSIEEIVATFAIARIGAVFVNINPQWTVHQLGYIIDDCDIRVLICDRRPAMQLIDSEYGHRLHAVLVRGAAPDDDRCDSWSELPQETVVDAARPLSNDLAALMYTSGSTGKPKGVMFSHRNVVDGARIVSTYLNNTREDRILSLLPMSFDYGMSQITTMFLVGGAVVLQPVPMPVEIVKTINAHEVSGFAAVPPTWIQVVRYLEETGERTPSLRYITNSGGKIPQAILELMPTVFPDAEIYLMYGLTEAFRSSYLPPHLFHEKMGSMGRAVPDVELFVVDAERGVCGTNEPGELIHRGALISGGYWGKPEATAERIRVNEHLRARIGDEPVVHSGDIVRMDDDGYLWFVSRADSMIKCSGFRISPTEVEDIVFQAGFVSDVVAYGEPDDELGQVVEIVVSAKDGRMIDADELRRYCRARMPHYMVPARIHVWEGSMPRTGSGKVDRPQVIEQCRSGASVQNTAGP